MKMKLTKVDAKVLQSIKEGGNFKSVANIVDELKTQITSSGVVATIKDSLKRMEAEGLLEISNYYEDTDTILYEDVMLTSKGINTIIADGYIVTDVPARFRY